MYNTIFSLNKYIYVILTVSEENVLWSILLNLYEFVFNITII